MLSIALNKVNIVEEEVKRESGDKTYPIWLLFNPKHPAVHHTIWTPVLTEIQDKVYREMRTRIDFSNIYRRNVIGKNALVPDSVNWWEAEIVNEIRLFKESVLVHQPKILISFGAFPYEFARRAFGTKPERGPKYWITPNLGEEFRKAIEGFNINKTNCLPLLRRVIACEKFIDDDDYSGNNYFHYVGTKIAEIIIENQESLKIWME